MANVKSTIPNSNDPNFLLFEFIEKAKTGEFTKEEPTVLEDENRLDLMEYVEEPECIYLGIA
jgi:hypothetical protein